MRHGERLDAVDPYGWFNSPAAKQYPFDCPLSEKGKLEVGNVALELAARSNGSFSCVVTSPFIRCVETAVEVCRTLNLPICIDMQLGEVFGPACFGEWRAPGPSRRHPEEVVSLVPPDVRKMSPVDFIGEEPAWPESIENARLRMVARVEQYAEWAARLEGVNFVLVTHGDCVGACLTLALAKPDGSINQVVEKVNYCGYALLEREWEAGEAAVGLLGESAHWRVQHGNVVVRDIETIEEFYALNSEEPTEEEPERTRNEQPPTSGTPFPTMMNPRKQAEALGDVDDLARGEGEADEVEYSERRRPPESRSAWSSCRMSTQGVKCV